MAKILLIDDDASLREVLAFTLREQGHEVETARDGAAGLALFERFGPDAIITDLKMPGIDGMEVLRTARERDPDVPVIMLTAFGTIEDAVAAMRAGAHNYLTKPYNRDELTLTVDQALERRRLVTENRTLRDRLREQRHAELICASPVMERIVATVRRVAPTDATVLITGESGTGKEVIAGALHAWSDRWEQPFVAINCSAIPRDLIESELFGHERGAFTGAVAHKQGKFRRADRGTIFLDEIADVPEDLQTKLLRVIETRQVDPVGAAQPVAVDVRVVAATNADLARRVADGRFRADLFYRLNVIPVHLPPLRERPEDIPALWEYFVRKYGGNRVRSSSDLVRALLRRPWPGNVRELANLAQRMVLLCGTDALDEDDLAELAEISAGRGADPAAASAIPDPPGGARIFPGELPPEGLNLPALEKELIVRALVRFGGNRSRAAAFLGVPRHVLIYRLEKYGIQG